MPGGLPDKMTAYLLWKDQNDRVPQRVIRDRLNPVEFYDNDEFSRRYHFSKDSVMQLERKVAPTIKHGSDRSAAVPTTSALSGPTVLCNWMFPDGGWGSFWTPQVNHLQDCSPCLVLLLV